MSHAMNVFHASDIGELLELPKRNAQLAIIEHDAP